MAGKAPCERWEQLPPGLQNGRIKVQCLPLVDAGVAQLVEHDVANVVVDGSNPFARFSFDLLSTANMAVFWERTQLTF